MSRDDALREWAGRPPTGMPEDEWLTQVRVGGRAAAKIQQLPGGREVELVAEALRAVYRRHAREERKFVNDQVAQAQIAGWNIDGAGMDLRVTMARETAAALVAAAKTFLDATSAQNYVEQQVIDRETGDRYTLTIQRPGGRTPHEMREAAERERDALRAELDAIVDLARHPVWLSGGRDALLDLLQTIHTRAKAAARKEP